MCELLHTQTAEASVVRLDCTTAACRGECNQNDQTDELWVRIDDSTPAPLDLERAPKGSTGPCWPGENPLFRQPIDYFIFNEDIRSCESRGSGFNFRETRGGR